MRVQAHRLYTDGPSDVSGLVRLLDDGTIAVSELLAVIGKTEGNGGMNDFTRELATRALADVLAPRLGCTAAQLEDRVVLSFSGGTEGVVSPHMLVLSRTGQPRSTALANKRLAIATGYTRDFDAGEAGYLAMVEETARVVRELVETLQVESPDDVHLVQIKGAIPHHGPEQAERALQAGRPLRCNMSYSRGASALGVALALGEVSSNELSDAVICHDWSLYSGVASVSAKPGLARSEITLFANSPYWDGDLCIAHDVMEDIIDIEAIRRVLEDLDIPIQGQLTATQSERLVGIFAKSDADPRNRIRGRRHTMWTDADFSDMRYSRCVVSALLAGLTGETAVYVSTRAEHHGPLGGGPVAIIARAS